MELSSTDHGPAGRECANAADEVRCGACSPRRCASCRARHAGVDINQVGVPVVDINQIPTALLTASAFNHLETATVLLASTAPICMHVCMGHGMAARGG